MAIGHLGLGLGGRRPHGPSAISSQCNVSIITGNKQPSHDEKSYQFT